MVDNRGWIYVMRHMTADLYKIGLAKHVQARLAALNGGVVMPAPVIILIHQFHTNDMYQVEKALHCHYAGKRRAGEWFALTPDDLTWLQSIPALTYNDHWRKARAQRASDPLYQAAYYIAAQDRVIDLPTIFTRAEQETEDALGLGFDALEM